MSKSEGEMVEVGSQAGEGSATPRLRSARPELFGELFDLTAHIGNVPVDFAVERRAMTQAVRNEIPKMGAIEPEPVNIIRLAGFRLMTNLALASTRVSETAMHVDIDIVVRFAMPRVARRNGCVSAEYAHMISHDQARQAGVLEFDTIRLVGPRTRR